MKRMCLWAAFGWSLGVLAQAVIPGEFTDPGNIRRRVQSDMAGYRSPEPQRYPYISTYYVKPTVTTDEKAAIRFFVTDFDSSKVRFLDDSFRFNVFLSLNGPKGEKVLEQKAVKSGDGRFNLGRLPVGDYRIGLWAVDAKGRASHRVWQEFRVRKAKDLEIPSTKVYRMTASDLKAYGIRNDGDYGRRIEVPVLPLANVPQNEQLEHAHREIDDYLREHPHQPAERPGYTVYVPVFDGKAHFRSYERARIIIDKGYDREAVEREAVATSDGLQRFLDEKAKAGFRTVQLLPGCYRLSATRTLSVPNQMTLDLNGATLKLHEFAGAAALMVKIDGVEDSHLVNGTLEGDYYEHDYANSKNDSEWVLGFSIMGAARYCSVEKVLVKDITGYGGSCGLGDTMKGGQYYFYQEMGKFFPGGLTAKDGTLDGRDAFRFTSDFRSLEKAKKQGRLQVSRFLGYQGMATRSWRMTACWYDAKKKFISSETLFQYREVPIPEKAEFLRVSVEAQSAELAEKAGLSICLFQYPVNCVMKDCVFDRCRCVGLAPNAMRNQLFEGNEFRFCGETAAKCAFDAEDGWDQMQDVTLTKNWFHDNPVNNSILTCAGQNFVIEHNRGDIFLWGRTHSPCVRNNESEKATYYCDSRWRSGYGRIENNRYTKSVKIATSPGNMTAGWDFVLSGLKVTGGKEDYSVDVDLGGRLLSCSFSNRTARVANAMACVFESCTASFIPDGRWYGCTVRGGSYHNFYKTNTYEKCTFDGVELHNFSKGRQVFTDCTFRNCSLPALSAANIRFERCTFINTTLTGGYWSQPATITFDSCRFELGRKPALDLGQYTIGRVEFKNCRVAPGAQAESASLFFISDLREQGTDKQEGLVVMQGCTVEKGVEKVVTVGRGPSKKCVVFNLSKNRLPKGMSVLDSKDIRPTWKVK